MAQADAERQSVANQHQVFKGIPIDGTQDAFVKKLEAKGFKREKRVDNCIYMSGRFAGYNNCQVFVDRNTYVNLVNSVGVSFPAADNWAQLQTAFNAMETMLTKKYGQPTDEVKEFVPFTPSGDPEKFAAVKANQCKYMANYKNGDKGTITLTIANGEKGVCFVVLKYIDRKNYKIGQEGAIDDL